MSTYESFDEELAVRNGEKVLKNKSPSLKSHSLGMVAHLDSLKSQNDSISESRPEDPEDENAAASVAEEQMAIPIVTQKSWNDSVRQSISGSLSSHNSVMIKLIDGLESQITSISESLPGDPETQSYRSASEEQMAIPIPLPKARFSIINEVGGSDSQRTSIDESIPEDLSEYSTPRMTLNTVTAESDHIKPFNPANYISNSDELLAIQYSSRDTTFERPDSPEIQSELVRKSVSENHSINQHNSEYSSCGNAQESEHSNFSSCETIPEDSIRHERTLRRFRYGAIDRPEEVIIQEPPPVVVGNEEQEPQRQEEDDNLFKNPCLFIAGTCCFLADALVSITGGLC